MHYVSFAVVVRIFGWTVNCNRCEILRMPMIACSSDVNKATCVMANATSNKAKAKAKATNPRPIKATATCCRSTASARQRTTDESTLTELSSTRNLFNNGEQSLNRWSVIFKRNSLMLPLMYRSFTASAEAKART